MYAAFIILFFFFAIFDEKILHFGLYYQLSPLLELVILAVLCLKTKGLVISIEASELAADSAPGLPAFLHVAPTTTAFSSLLICGSWIVRKLYHHFLPQ